MVRVYKYSQHGESGGEWLTPVRYSSKGFKWTIKVDKDNRTVSGHCVVCGKLSSEKY